MKLVFLTLKYIFTIETLTSLKFQALPAVPAGSYSALGGFCQRIYNDETSGARCRGGMVWEAGHRSS